ncbi:hypothetical protein AVEN_113792-1, partial [Araneus ventricosus]
MVVEAFWSFIETGIEENWVKVSVSLNDGFLDFGIGSEMCDLPAASSTVRRD